MAEKKDPIRSLIDTGRRAGKLTSSEISDAMEENGNVLDVEAMEKLYEELESNGIEIVDDTPVDVSSALPSSGYRQHNSFLQCFIRPVSSSFPSWPEDFMARDLAAAHHRPAAPL